MISNGKQRVVVLGHLDFGAKLPGFKYKCMIYLLCDLEKSLNLSAFNFLTSRGYYDG